MRKPIVLVAALLLSIGGWQPAQAQFPCMCRGQEYESPGGPSTYIAFYHEVDCDDFMAIFLEDASGLPEQTCPDCDPAYTKVKNPAAAKNNSQPSEVNVLMKKPAQPKQKKAKDFLPKGKGIEAKPQAIIKFSLQGEQDPCYVKVFSVKHFDNPDTETVEASGEFDVGFEIEPVPDSEPGLIKYNAHESLAKVRSLKLKHPDQGTIVVPHHYLVKVGLIEYTVLATR